MVLIIIIGIIVAIYYFTNSKSNSCSNISNKHIVSEYTEQYNNTNRDNDKDKHICYGNTQKEITNQFHIAGIPHRIGKVKPSSVLHVGQELNAIREPTNPHDSNAIALYASGKKIGFIPRVYNTRFARDMDKGSELRVVVVKIKDSAPWDGVIINVESNKINI